MLKIDFKLHQAGSHYILSLLLTLGLWAADHYFHATTVAVDWMATINEDHMHILELEKRVQKLERK